MQHEATGVAAPAVPRNRRRVERWFYIGAALSLILLSVAGFGPSRIDPSGRNAALTPLVAAHGGIAVAWLVLFLTQATLIATRRTPVHRRLGQVGPVLAVVMIVLSGIATVGVVRRGYDLSGDLTRAFARPGARVPVAAGLLFPLSEIMTFGVLVGAGLWYRHRPDVHKRLMLLALVPLAVEPVVHLVGHLSRFWPALHTAGRVVNPLTTLLLLSVSAVHDRVSQGRIHPVSLWVPLVVLAWMLLQPLVILPSAAWQAFAAWVVR
jgi:uncharacterized membrane protein YidH (DUF202 family)